MENISDEFINAGVDDSVLVDLKNVSVSDAQKHAHLIYLSYGYTN
jgi:hypothetical protein